MSKVCFDEHIFYFGTFLRVKITIYKFRDINIASRKVDSDNYDSFDNCGCIFDENIEKF
ncbi:MAG: hypothetical protein GY714_03995 [Desulfobacterales bacterium]|nr:hypothetical protein [Desulfobacterales bacterium]